MYQRSTIDMPDLFSITAIWRYCLLIALAVGGYYFLVTHHLFSESTHTIYICVKIFIALNIILGSARSAAMPVLILLVGLLFLFLNEVENITLISLTDSWELIIASFVGLVITMSARW